MHGTARDAGRLDPATDAAKIRASEVRQQKHDRRDAALLLRLLCEKRFPRIWTPSSEERDARQLLIHRHKLVRLRAQVKNGLQHLAMNRGMQKKRRLWSAAGQQALRELALQPWADRRREDLLKLLAMFDGQVASLDVAVKAAAADGMTTLRQDGWKKVLEGRTTIEEVARNTKGDISAFGTSH